MHLYEDLIAINRSKKLIDAVVERKDRVLNVQNKRRGVTARRGDGTFGEIIPGEMPIVDPGYIVARGPIATVEIRNQVVQFKRGGGNPICVGVVGINCADHTIGYEGDRPFPTTGKAGFLHPFQESPEAERRLRVHAGEEFDEFFVLRFKATNEGSFPFEWSNYKETRLDYGAGLVRISANYQQRF